MFTLSVAGGIGIAEALTAHPLAGLLGCIGQEYDEWSAGKVQRKG